MDIRYLDSLIAVVEFGSIAQAARSQNLTAAAIGQPFPRINQFMLSFITEADGYEGIRFRCIAGAILGW